MNPSKFIFYGSVLLPLVQFCFCSLPSDVKPVRWKMNIELPVTDQRFYTRDLLPVNAVPGLDLRFGKDSLLPDTVTIVKSDSLKYVIEKQLVTTDTSINEKKFGARALDKSPTVNAFFGLTENMTAVVGPQQLPMPLILSRSQVKPLNGIQSVTVDSSSPPLQVHVANQSQQAVMKNVEVVLLDAGDTIDKIRTSSLAAQSSMVAPLHLGGKTIHDPITVAIHAEVDSGTAIYPTDGLRVTFSLDGQMVENAVVIDSMIKYADVFTGNFSVADSIRLDVIDLDDALLRCEVSNPSKLKVEMKGVIDDAWKYDFAIAHNLQEYADLKTVSDSSGFAGNIMKDTVSKNPALLNQTFIMPLKNLRLFLTWNADSGRSVLKYRYTVKSLSDGRQIRFNKNDKFVFKLIPSRFPFIRIKGAIMQSSVQSFSSRQKIGFGWKNSIIDSLKKSFRFQGAKMRLDLVSNLPANSSMDSLLLHVSLRETSRNDSVVIDQTISDIRTGSLHSVTADLTTILNDWPDSIGFDAQLKIPAGANIDIYNEKKPDGTYKSSLTIGVAVNYSVTIPLAWNVLDTIRTELEQSSISPKVEDLNWINKIGDPAVQLEMAAVNNTNLALTLYAVGAGESYKDGLSAFPGSLIGTAGMDEGLGAHLFSLFGNEGISLASRGKSSAATVKLDKRGLDALMSKQKCLIRWFLVIPAAAPDAFTSTDYIDLKASAVIKGTGDSDSLLYEDK